MNAMTRIVSDTPADARPPRARPRETAPIRVLVVTDAWRPQVNGVVRTLEWLRAETPAFGVELIFLTPERFRTVGMPTYPEIRLALASPSSVYKIIDSLAPDAIHIATEGPLGFLARRYALARRRPFTTCYHTRYPEYVAARAPAPLWLGYALMRRFHAPAAATLVASESLRSELASRGFSNLRVWRRGVDTALFANASRAPLPWPRPVFLAVGRVAIEKNLEAFLSLDLPGTKVVVGEGPARAALERKYPAAKFPGARAGAELATLYASADALVFPSLTDTFGLVMVEALAAGTPVAAFPAAAPMEILRGGECGALDADLRSAALAALRVDRAACRRHAATRDMVASARSFLKNIADALAIKPLADRLAAFDAAGRDCGPKASARVT